MFQFQKITLENGVRLIVAGMDTKHGVIAIFVKNGSQYEEKQENGIAHCVEHYLFRGTRKLADFRAVEETFLNIQACPHAQTDWEESSYLVRLPMCHFSTGLDVLSDILIFPTFKPEEMDIEKKMLTHEMGSWLDRPAEYLRGDPWAKVCFGDQPAGRPVLGTEETIRSFTAKKLERFYKKHYVGEAIVVVVVGDKDIVDFIPRIKEIFGKIRSGLVRNSFPIKDSQKNPKYLVLAKDTALTHIYLGVKTPFRPMDMEGYAAEILAGIINYNLYLSMVGDRGLAYERDTQYFEDPTKGFLATYAGVTHDRIEEAIRLILGEYKRIRELGVTNKELTEQTKLYLDGLQEGFNDEPLVPASFFGYDELYTGNIHSPREEFERIKSVTRQDIQEVARRIFLSQNLNLVIVGPHEESKEFTNFLTDLLKNF